MKPIKFRELWMLIILFILIGCEKDNSHNQVNIISGKLVNHSECKSNLKSTTTDNQSCINYSYDNINKKLTITHFNAAFNCCPDSLYCVVSMTGNKILITECEKQPLCNCDCLFDLEIEIDGIKSGLYMITIDEPYVDDQSMIFFRIDLTKKKEDLFCIHRDQYPWSI